MRKKFLVIIFSLLFIISISSFLYVVSADDEIVDISQDIDEECIFFEDYAYQEFKPTIDLITEVQLKIANTYCGPQNLTLSIEQPIGHTLTNLSVPCSTTPNIICDWLSFDINDTIVTPGQSYYLVLEYPLGGEYSWSGSSSNPYDDGSSSQDSDWDFCFKIIGIDESTNYNMEITKIDTYKEVYEPDEIIYFYIIMNNVGDKPDVSISSIIRNKFSNDITYNFENVTLDGFTGRYVLPQIWQSSNKKPGDYIINVTIYDTTGLEIDNKSQAFKIGTFIGEIQDLLVNPENFSIGDNVNISLKFINNGTEEINGICYIDIKNLSYNNTYNFQINIQNLDSNGLVNISQNWDTDDIIKGEYNITCYVQYNNKTTDLLSKNVFVNNISIIPEENDNFTKNSNQTENSTIKDDEIVDDSKDDDLQPEIVVISAAVIAASLTGLAAPFLSEDIKYKYYLLLGFCIPLFTRIQKNEALENPIRDEIYGYIKVNPGTHYTKIKRNLDIGNGTLTHHLSILEKTGYITSRTEGFRYRMFYPSDQKIPEAKEYILNDIQKSILKIIKDKNGTTQKDLINKLGESQQKISYNLKELEKVNEIVKIKNKGVNYYYIPKYRSDGYTNQ